MRRRFCVSLLERHQLTERMFAEIRSLLEQKWLLLKSGTIVDASIIEAPPSTKNEQKARDPEMRQGKKGGGWHFGMKVHIAGAWIIAGAPSSAASATV
jgi:transposase, IS5 family